MRSGNIASQPVLTGKLSSEAEVLLSMIRESGFPGWSALGVENGRAAIAGMKGFAGDPEPVARVEDLRISTADGATIAGRLYVPATSAPPPVMLYLHGGGWVLGDHTSVDTLVRRLANRSQCAMLSIDYRLAPEHKYPAALEDVTHAVRWLFDHGEDQGLDSHRIAVRGDSSGANLAAAASLLARDRGGPPIRFQLLVYPALDCNYERPSYQKFGDGALSALSTSDVEWFHSHYVSSPADLVEPGICPLRAATLANAPRTLLIAAELDPLIDENAEFAEKLAEAGVPVQFRIYPGMFHGFWRMGGVLAAAREAIDQAADDMAAAMHD